MLQLHNRYVLTAGCGSASVSQIDRLHDHLTRCANEVFRLYLDCRNQSSPLAHHTLWHSPDSVDDSTQLLYIDMFRDVCIDMCKDTSTDMRIETCTDMRADTCTTVCVSILYKDMDMSMTI